MKKITAKIIAAVMAVLMLASIAGCAAAEPVKFDVGNGMSIVLPADMQEIEMEGFAKILANEKVGVYFVRETVDELAAVGLENLTLEEYAELSQTAYSLENPYTADANGNLVTTYNADVDGSNFFYYTTLRQGADCFWTINFACEDAVKGEFTDLFTQWNASIVVE